MINIKKSYKIFIVSLFLVGFITGIIYFITQDKSLIKDYISNIKDINPIPNIISNQFILISIIILLSFSIIGYPIILFIYFYEAISLAFTFSSFTYFLGLKGLIFYLIYFIIFNLIYYIALFYLTNISYEITIKLIDTIKHKYELNVGYFFRNYIYRFIVILLVLLLFNVLMYFLGINILKLFIFI